MIKFVFSICLFALLSLTSACCQSISSDPQPLELAQRIFNPNGFSTFDQYITGEYKKERKGHPNGKDINQKNAQRTFHLLSQTNQQSVVDMTITNQAGLATDYYLYFVKEGVWKMQAFRSLAMAGFGLFEKKQLERYSAQQVDSIIAVSQNKPGTYSPFSSRAEYNFKLGNARLLSLSDEGLIAFFKQHKAQFDSLKAVVLAGKVELKKSKTADPEVNMQRRKAVEAGWKVATQKLSISYVSSSDSDFKNSVEMVIWGMVDNTVGYVYIPDKQDIPPMSPDHIILLRAMGEGWFLYKTT